MKKAILVLGLVLGLGTLAVSRAQNLDDIDRTFVKDACQASLAEIGLGKLARDRTINEDVLKLGQKLIDDHAKSNEELKALCVKKGYVLPTDVNMAQTGTKEHLSKLASDDFDHEFVRVEIEDHRKVIRLFEAAKDKMQSDELKQFAARALPMLKEHLAMAEQLAQKIGISGY